MGKLFSGYPADSSPSLTDLVPTKDTESGTNRTATLQKVAELFAASTQLAAFYSPSGYLINGKITTSVAANDLTVAIKTLAGTDPSATNPVYCRIGSSVRAITAALSVTRADGTNWLNAGATEHAGQDIDFFVYLGYNATDGVVIGFSRIPHARVYGDFLLASSSDNHCAISTITTAASTDEYEVVGRFNASLSATAAFNWSIPATSIVIQRPIFNTRTLTYNPVLSGRFTDSKWNKTCTYLIRGREAYVNLALIANTTTPMGGGSADLIGTLPITGASLTATANITPLGVAKCYDATGSVYPGQVMVSSTTTWISRLGVNNTTITDLTTLSSTVPFTWTTSDEVASTFTYGLR